MIDDSSSGDLIALDTVETPEQKQARYQREAPHAFHLVQTELFFDPALMKVDHIITDRKGLFVCFSFFLDF
jgi:hypothetical protein